MRSAAIESDDVADWCGVSVTTAARTIIDLARHGRRNAIMAADAALHEG